MSSGFQISMTGNISTECGPVALLTPQSRIKVSSSSMLPQPTAKAPESSTRTSWPLGEEFRARDKDLVCCRSICELLYMRSLTIALQTGSAANMPSTPYGWLSSLRSRSRVLAGSGRRGSSPSCSLALVGRGGRQRLRPRGRLGAVYDGDVCHRACAVSHPRLSAHLLLLLVGDPATL